MKNTVLSMEALAAKLGSSPETSHAQYFLGAPGQEHYLLLSKLASELQDSTIVDIGTHFGYSALALSGGSNRVVTFDIADLKQVDLPESVESRIVNILDQPCEFPLDAKLALLDIDPHSGREERLIVEMLLQRGWQGRLVCDDINLNDGMRGFWDWAQHQQELTASDLTEEGHVTGTGLLTFCC